MGAVIQIKGIREGLLVTTGDGQWEVVQKELLDHLDQQAEFLRGARLALDVGNHTLKATDLGPLRNEILERNLSLWAVISNSPTTEKTAQTLGLATRLSKPVKESTARGPDTTLHEGEEAIFVQRTLRSGYSLVYPGHVIVLGDINPGAEVIGSGNIIVWGKLRGVVHAGAEGEEQAIIAALELSPTQLRIAGQIANLPRRRTKNQPEMARLVNGEIVVDAWNSKRGK